MKQRVVTAIIVVLVALWGAGVPRFAHVMTAHIPGKDGLSSSCSHCCSQCTLSPTVVESAETADPDDEAGDDNDDSSQPHHCPICELLATLVTNVAAVPATSLAWEPVVERIAEAPAPIAPRVEFDLHAPRGPPPAA